MLAGEESIVEQRSVRRLCSAADGQRTFTGEPDLAPVAERGGQQHRVSPRGIAGRGLLWLRVLSLVD
jgi:hypothetical protein